MSQLAQEILVDPGFHDDLTFALDMAELAERDWGAALDSIDEMYAAHMNPLGLTAADLVAAGWDADVAGESWYHVAHGACSFLGATRKEADKALPRVPEVF